jgi:hypothetical protein
LKFYRACLGNVDIDIIPTEPNDKFREEVEEIVGGKGLCNTNLVWKYVNALVSQVIFSIPEGEKKNAKNFLKVLSDIQGQFVGISPKVKLGVYPDRKKDLIVAAVISILSKVKKKNDPLTFTLNLLNSGDEQDLVVNEKIDENPRLNEVLEASGLPVGFASKVEGIVEYINNKTTDSQLSRVYFFISLKKIKKIKAKKKDVSRNRRKEKRVVSESIPIPKPRPKSRKSRSKPTSRISRKRIRKVKEESESESEEEREGDCIQRSKVPPLPHQQKVIDAFNKTRV